jgi:hemerythrin-like metal-binding protein
MQLHVEDMDVQHRRVMQLVTELATLLEADQRQCRSVRRALAGLISFLEIHCSDEEEFMRRNGYPTGLLDVHQSAHREFIARLRIVYNRADPELMALVPGLVAWMRNWIDDHNYTEDRAYLDHFRRQFCI